MKITKQENDFKPITITLESLHDLICMRAVADAAARGRTIEQAFCAWGRSPEAEPNTPSAMDFARVLNERLSSYSMN